MDEMIFVDSNPSLKGNSKLIPNIIFSDIGGVILKMALLVPWSIDNENDNKYYPTIVFLQGSGWRKPDPFYELPQLSEYSRHGYIVALITHRNSEDGFPAPTFLKDSKTAIRFLRKHADNYKIDTERIGFFGTSSGGNTSLLISLTADRLEYKTEEFNEYSDSVSCAVSCFGPTNLPELYNKEGRTEQKGLPNENKLFNGNILDNMKLAKEMSPIFWITESSTHPKLLLLHGTKDFVVPFEQSLNFHKSYTEKGYDSRLIAIKDAGHEGDFWSKEVHKLIIEFFDSHL